ncbi:TPA: restriction endonuclease subunit S [Clostridioides difficile]|uniref:restriction endonuclease subunit S n=1 Tax=Clostridioides difficile TaxID=1496 RepID=UPI00093FB0DD|nr:restriction endonuclease subunit S [Clostridioides difficile]MBY1103871.1 restriction endonuclease subunit S [Clostridioides difficile]MDC9475586.1 restriction endonuclease subunit S [Clostridioides difficile]HBE9760577.1 restriction endonuclease subunit S [Clostridioides difficile]HBE9786754.1 restriction endonuclease subunit S [Clostridioides difficile]HBG1613766.1 restriction endonuclease subunit S [Clostridioides difficile]
MKSEIVNKINLINKGKIPEGYKKTEKSKIIPREWQIKKFDECIEITKGQVNPNINPYCKMIHIGLANIEKLTGRLLYTNLANEEDLTSSKYYFDKDTVLYGKIRPELGKVLYANFEGICSADIYPLKTLHNLKAKYLKYILLDNKFYKFTVRSSMRTGMPKINREDLSTYVFTIPTINEQEKISEILDTWDKLIELKEMLIKEKQKNKKGLMERLLTGKVRLKGFNDKWNRIKLDKLIEESKEKSIENNQHNILSVTKEGIYLQSEYFNRQIASKDNIGYKVVRKNNLVFSTMNLWMGSIDILNKYDIGIVSPACKVFYLNEELVDISFMKYFIKSSYMMNLYSLNSEQGASIVRRNLDLKGLLSTNVRLPNIDEQKKIGEILGISSREIDLLEKEVELLKEQKKGLMQLLLTGIVRV